MQRENDSVGLLLAISAPMIAAGLVLACSSNLKSTTIPRAKLGTKYARQTDYFAACAVGCQEEKTRGGIRHDVIRDEAMLMTAGPDETCIDLIVRTQGSLDEPFDQLEPSCQLDGRQLSAVVEAEAVSVLDYNYTGQVETVHGEAMTQDAFLGLSLTETRDMVFRVIERKGRICCAAAAGQSVRLQLHNPHHDVGVTDGVVDFEWSLQ